MNLNETLLLPKCNETEECLKLFEPFLFIDDLKIFLALPLSIIGTIINLLCVIVLMKNIFKERIYKYCLIYFLNNGINGFFDSLQYIPTRKYGNLLNNYWVLFYLSNINYNVQNILFTFSNYLDCWILLEIISIIKNRLIKIQRYSAYNICFYIFLFSLTVCIPSFFFSTIDSNRAVKNSTEMYVHYVIVPTKFSKSQAGIFFIFLSYFIKDFSVKFIRILFIMITISSLKKHLENKKKLRGFNNELMVPDNEKNINNEKFIKLKKIEIKNKKLDEKLTIAFIFWCIYSVFFNIIWVVLNLVILKFNLEKYFSVFFILFILQTLRNTTSVFILYDNTLFIQGLKELNCLKLRNEPIIV